MSDEVPFVKVTIDTMYVKLWEVATKLDKLENLPEQLQKMNDRITDLESFKWKLTGAVALMTVVIPIIITFALKGAAQ